MRVEDTQPDRTRLPGVAAVKPQRVGTLPQQPPDFAVHLREKFNQLLLQKGRVGALLQLAQDLEQTALDVGSLSTSQLQGVKGVEQFLLDAPVAIDGPHARRDHRREYSRLQLLKVRERARWVWSTQCFMETVENGGRHFPAVQIRTNDLCHCGPNDCDRSKSRLTSGNPFVPALRRRKYDAGHSVQKDIEDGAVVRMKA